MQLQSGVESNRYFIKRTIVIICLVYLIIIAFFSWKISDNHSAFNSIASDGVGYYMYLPSIFITGEFGKEPAEDRHIINTRHGPLSRYSAGTAIAILPFFGVACLYYEIIGEVYTGFEPGFQNAVLLAATSFFLLGLYLMGLLMSRFTNSKWTISVALLTVALGSNALFYTVQAPSFSHVYSFCAITGFLLSVKRYMESFRMKYFLIASLVFGFILLLRQFNGFILFAVPFLANSFSDLISFLKNVFGNVKLLISGIVLAVAVAAIQQVFWFIQTGDLVLWGYGNDGFYFSKPAFFEVLLSFRKGLFVYTPLLLVSFFGLISLYRKNQYRFYCFIGFFIFLTYFMSSWWMWYYGSSFGQRPFIEYYGLLFIPLIFLTDHFSQFARRYLLVPLIAGLAALNFIQSYQYSMEILQPADMNFQKYQYVFLKTSKNYWGILGGNKDIIPFHNGKLIVFDLSIEFDENQDRIQNEVLSIDPGNSVNKVSDYRNREFNTALTIPLEAQRITRRSLFAEIGFEVLKTASTDLREDALLVFEVRDSVGERYMYYPFRIHDIPTNEINVWHRYSYTVEIPARNASDTMSIYVWNKHLHPLLLDNLEFKLFAFPE